MTTIHVTIDKEINIYQYENLRDAIQFTVELEGYDNPTFDYTEGVTKNSKDGKAKKL